MTRAFLATGALAFSVAGCAPPGSSAPAGAGLAKASVRQSDPALRGAAKKLPKGYAVLYSFQGAPDGAVPFGGVVVDRKGDIFGTTYSGGANSAGTVFELIPSRKSYAETVLHDFSGSDGSGPGASPLLDQSGNLFVTAIGGGRYGAGTAIELSESHNVYGEAGAYSFGSGTDGSSPNASLLQQDATLYTTTASGGKYGNGAIVALTDSGLTETDVYDFQNGSDGAYPLANLVADASGTLYGTTTSGGTAGAGTVFEFVPGQNGGRESVLWTFQAKSGNDGSSPNGGVILDAKGDIFGTTTVGGSSHDGVVFKLTKKDGRYVESILHTFLGGADGAQPSAGLTFSDDVLYGSTSSGSGSLCNACGTLFRLSPEGKAYQILHTFQGSDGSNPLGPLFLSGSALYGTTSNGGTNASGVVFRLVP